MPTHGRARQTPRPLARRTGRILAPGLLVAASAFLGTAAHAEILRVPQDFDSIQEAVDAAGPGDEIVVSKGSYPPFSVEGKTGLAIRGKGKVLVQSLVKMEGAGPAVTLTDSDGVSLSKLRFENTPGDALLVTGCTNVLLSKLRIDNAGNNAIQLFDTTDTVIEKTRIDVTQADAIRTDACQRITVERCFIRDAGDDAVALSTGNPGQPTHQSLVCRTRILHPADDGVDVDGNDNVVERVLVRDAMEDGFEVDTDGVGSNNTFTKCRAVKPACLGFVIAGSMNTLDQCAVVRSGDDAVALLGTGSHTVQRLRANKPAFDGIFVADGSTDNELTDNKIAGPSDDGLDVQTTGNTASGNKVSKAGDNGLEVEAPGNTFIGNRFKGSAGLDISDTSGGANTYTDNEFKTSNLP